MFQDPSNSLQFLKLVTTPRLPFLAAGQAIFQATPKFLRNPYILSSIMRNFNILATLKFFGTLKFLKKKTLKILKTLKFLGTLKILATLNSLFWQPSNSYLRNPQMLRNPQLLSNLFSLPVLVPASSRMAHMGQTSGSRLASQKGVGTRKRAVFLRFPSQNPTRVDQFPGRTVPMLGVPLLTEGTLYSEKIPCFGLACGW